MAAFGPLVVSTPQGIEVKGRRRIGDAAAFENLLEELTSRMQQEANSDKGVLISDLDLSQNSLTFDQFEALFVQLGANSARVQRFRLFGCVTLNDEVVRVLADYLRPLTNETAPTEMHLSDCAITSEGWNCLMNVIEEGDLYPVQSPQGRRPAPLYLRLENNYVGEDAIQEKIDAGVVRPFKKMSTGPRPGAEGGVKVNLVVRNDGGFQQKRGEPPAPEDAPAPKQVYDKYADSVNQSSSFGRSAGKGSSGGYRDQGRSSGGSSYGGSWDRGSSGGGSGYNGSSGGGYGGGSSYGGDRGSSGHRQYGFDNSSSSSRYGSSSPAAPALGSGRSGGSPWTPRSSSGGGGGGGSGAFNAFGSGGNSTRGGGGGETGRNGHSSWTQSSNGGGGGSSWSRGGSYDRSRTPVDRIGGGRGGSSNHAQPSGPAPKAKASDLPQPWEENWSEEYQIPYYWNSETGESLWEKPTA